MMLVSWQELKSLLAGFTSLDERKDNKVPPIHHLNGIDYYVSHVPTR
jgi:hypothetical protein